MSDTRRRWAWYCFFFWIAMLEVNFIWILIVRTMSTGMNLIEIFLKVSFGLSHLQIQKWAPIVFMLPLIVMIVLILWPERSKPPPT
ncbi:MAG: hypothetical protein CO030_00590 [Candidatus Magasanikbacteria bacterium CG_4_9_14_0_2_um_filter_42_11]|uniref:Uncharacterized protein n=1 Tax=Candidatus Magasanikbacteria bacterium CG_4_9_14_0_2_um_filter_42_11 TaxID=1974643 RepID=A0A2M8FAW5_9BACT|nr:MAG: hypothetical protein COU34_01825 [Candidatus Magasanikbacteria bacterium CG10_big_fil_rev_8_21_14_0_10_43_9]PIY92369.1 MAG: hypothetical protein COY70_03685 [Candidatus Magasanikbacteria bacterium CG_4_10_14_0_8_um_filter_42_12]PJC52872.1 MAG: hypothetical protein CO030_00590 [Candidatus Magasanikbacteria bacterium CG_4_9_14_0_2_um_filter_42_11]